MSKDLDLSKVPFNSLTHLELHGKTQFIRDQAKQERIRREIRKEQEKVILELFDTWESTERIINSLVILGWSETEATEIVNFAVYGI